MRRNPFGIHRVEFGWLTAALLVAVAAASAADSPAALKSAFKDHFLIGAAFNQRQFTEQDTNDVALVKRHFNSISPENDQSADLRTCLKIGNPSSSPKPNANSRRSPQDARIHRLRPG